MSLNASMRSLEWKAQHWKMLRHFQYVETVREGDIGGELIEFEELNTAVKIRTGVGRRELSQMAEIQRDIIVFDTPDLHEVVYLAGVEPTRLFSGLWRPGASDIHRSRLTSAAAPSHPQLSTTELIMGPFESGLGEYQVVLTGYHVCGVASNLPRKDPDNLCPICRWHGLKREHPRIH